MILRAAALAIALASGCLPALAQAGSDAPAEGARQAADDLRGAVEALNAAKGARDRVAALTRTIRAYESGLGALRDGLRRAAIREREIAAEFEAKRDRIGQLLAVMATMESGEVPLSLLHPGGPEGTVRSALILSAVTPALQAEAKALQERLQEVADLRRLQTEAADTLGRGLTAAQEARTALSQAMQDRTDLPRRFLEDPEELKELLASVETLDGFASGLIEMETDVSAPMEDFRAAKGNLPLPVYGTLLRRAGEADAAGIVRPGILIATRPAALVTAPWPATIRYRGPLLDYGNVMILEPAAGYLLILAGLGTVYGETGDVVDAGAPLGLMTGDDTAADAAEEGSGAGRTETLYMELRQGKTTLDPAPWFRETAE